MSQPALADVAGASRSAVVSWEKDVSAPTASALALIAEAGGDVLYIVTGRRTAGRPESAATQIEDQLAAMRRDLLEPSRHRRLDEDEETTDRRMLERHSGALDAIFRYDDGFLTPELRDEAESLQAIVSDPLKLAAFRAADYAQMKARRRDAKERLAQWFGGEAYEPGDAVMASLAALALEYGVPFKRLVEVVHEVHEDIVCRGSDAP